MVVGGGVVSVSLASASVDHTVRLWDATTGALRSIEGHLGWARVVTFSLDG